MAERKIIWTKKAIAERQKIFEYWNKRNQSKLFSQKLYLLFKSELEILKSNPESGILNERHSFRHLIIRDYLLFYDFTDREIVVLTVWDGRRNPDLLNF